MKVESFHRVKHYLSCSSLEHLRSHEQSQKFMGEI